MAKHINNGRGKRLPVVTDRSSVSEEIQHVAVEKTAAIVTAKEADEIRKRLNELRGSVEAGYFEMGKLLHDVKEKVTEENKPLWKVWGFDTFDRYCEEELGFRERKGHYLLSIYKNTVEGPLTQEAVEVLGWSKASILAPLANDGIITGENAKKWMDKAKDSTFEELRSMTRLARKKSEKKSDGGGDKQTAPEEVQIFRVGLFKDQWENLQVALKKAEAITGSDKTPWLLDCICLSFNSEAFTDKDGGLDEVCRRVERVFGVKLLAFKAEDEQIVFGERVAKMIMAATPAKKEKK